MNWWIFRELSTLDIVVFLLCIVGAFFLCKRIHTYGKKFLWLFAALCLVHYMLTPYNALGANDSVIYYSHAKELGGFILGQRGVLVESFTWFLIHYLNLTFLGCSFVFSFIGLLGWYLLLVVLIDIIKRWNGWLLFLLLPELHYWTCFMGKDSLVFFAICVVLYTWHFHKSIVYYVVPCVIIGYIRAPVLLVVTAAFGVHILFQSKTHLIRKIFIGGLSLLAFAIFLPMAIEQIQMDEFDMENVENYIERNERYHQDEQFGSSVDMQGQPIYTKMFAYQFRPLFYDAKGALQLEASFENACWLLLFMLICFRFKRRYILWFPFLAYIALWVSQSLGLNNLGIAMRQKMMFFPFFITLFFQTLYDSKQRMQSRIKRRSLRIGTND